MKDARAYHGSMARIEITNGSLEVQLTPLECLGGLHGSMVIPLSAIQGVRLVDRPFRALRGFRAPGTGFPGVIALGTWRYRGGKDFVAVYGKQAAIQLDLSGAEFDRLLISTPEPEAVLARIERLVRG